MAEASGLSILVDEKRVNDVLRQKTGARAVCLSVVNLVVFICFIGLFNFLALSEPFEITRSYEGYIRRRFDLGAPISVGRVKSISDFWEYTSRTLMPGIYGNNTARFFNPGAVIPVFLPIDESQNLLFGQVRMRTVRVKSKLGCSVTDSMRSSFATCYGPFEVEAENKTDYGPVALEGGLKFRRGSVSKEEPYGGELALYPPGGFIQALTPDYNTSNNNLRGLQDGGWIGVPTRAIFYEFTIYNHNLGLFAVCSVVFEVAPTGRWVNTFNVDVLMQRHFAPLGSGSTAEWLSLAGEAILVLFVLRYLLEEASEFISCGGGGLSLKFDYFLDAWNLLDWTNMILMIVCLGLRISTWSKASSLEVNFSDPFAVQGGVSKYIDFTGIARDVRMIRSLTAFNAVLTWFKAVKYITIIPFITIFMETVTLTQQRLVSFMVFLFTTFLGFVLAYHVAFGEQLSTFRTTWKAWVFLMRSFLGNADMSLVYTRSPVLGSLLIILFVLGMIFIILNLFYAIMVSGLSDAKLSQDAKQQEKYSQMYGRLEDSWHTAKTNFHLEVRFRTSFPGLYWRIMNKRSAQQKLEKLRDAEVLKKERAKRPVEVQALGPASPSIGRRQRRARATFAIEDKGESSGSEGSEPDLGPLHDKEQLMRQEEVDKLNETAGPNFMSTSGSKSGKLGSSNVPSTQDAEPNLEAIDLVIDATQYVVRGLVDRTNGARHILLSEMRSSQEVLQGVGAVLEVLGRRADSLNAQQKYYLERN